MKAVFSGKQSLKEFFDPASHPYIPLVQLPKSIHGFDEDDVVIYAKMMNMMPLGNVKSLPAFAMLSEAEKVGTLDGVSDLVESSSGNTIFSLGVMAKSFGIVRSHAYASEDVSPGKLALLQLAGVHVHLHREPICPNPEDKNSGIQKARIQSRKAGWCNLDQYTHPSNPLAHERVTAKQIWEQLDGDLDIFCAGLGTTGTFSGTSRALKSYDSRVQCIGAVRSPNNPVPGVRTETLLAPTGFSYEKHLDEIVEVGTEESFQLSLTMIRHGLLVGPSSGFALAGLLKHLQGLSIENTPVEPELPSKQKNPLVCVFICCDTPYPYVDEYFEYLPEKYFPPITHQQGASVTSEENTIRRPSVPEVAANQAYKELYDVTVDEAWHMLHHNKIPKLRSGVILLDLRSDQEFEECHAPGAQRTTSFDREALEKGTRVYVMCAYGGESLAYVEELRRDALEAVSLSGGMLTWSKQNLPRERHFSCKLH